METEARAVFLVFRSILLVTVSEVAHMIMPRYLQDYLVMVIPNDLGVPGGIVGIPLVPLSFSIIS